MMEIEELLKKHGLRVEGAPAIVLAAARISLGAKRAIPPYGNQVFLDRMSPMHMRAATIQEALDSWLDVFGGNKEYEVITKERMREKYPNGIDPLSFKVMSDADAWWQGCELREKLIRDLFRGEEE